jgi:hypothetical protein
MVKPMQLGPMLDRCRRLEERAAALYRSFAAGSRSDPRLCALWIEMSREEEQHARSIETTEDGLRVEDGWRTSLDGWEEALVDVERCLTAGERLGAGATPSEQLSSALDLELSELDALRRVLLTVTGRPDRSDPSRHAEHLAEMAEPLSDDPHVRLQAALLLARARLKPPA